jgi:hypothetical protein
VDAGITGSADVACGFDGKLHPGLLSNTTVDISKVMNCRGGLQSGDGRDKAFKVIDL